MCQLTLSTTDVEWWHVEWYSSHMSTDIYWGVRVPTPWNAPREHRPWPQVTEIHPASQHRHSVCGILRSLESTQKVAPGSHLWDSTVPQLGTKPPPVLSQGTPVSTNHEAVLHLSVSPTSQPGQTPTPYFFTPSRFPGLRGETEQQCPSPHIPFTPILLALFPFGSRPGLL